MDDKKRLRLKVVFPFFAATIMVLGMVIGFRLHDTLRNKRDISTVVERSDRLEQLIDLIRQNYVDSINTDGLYSDAIKGILSHLDPHTTYIPADELDAVNDGLSGSFFGIGIEYAIIRDSLQVTYVVPNGPSALAGVRVGDRIIKVNDTLVAGAGLPSQSIVDKLRGAQNTEVDVSVKSIDAPGIRDLKIVRDEVPIVSVDAGFMLDANTGYIKINRFSATTYAEFAKALTAVKRKGATNLILDLRQNPGGYLDAARDIADEFLDDHKLIVYTKSLHEKEQDYRAVNDGMFEEGRLIILIDEGSASASEILAGAVQDWDRGVIVGHRSFGKGLVQEQYNLDDGSALRLTIARYYTPSGRSIQRSFKKGKAAYAAAYAARFKDGELTGDTSVAKEDTQAYYTLVTHRLVHGGGGIKPDVYVPYDSGRISPEMLHLLVSDHLQEAIWDYYSEHYKSLKSYQSSLDFSRNFKGGTDILESFLRKLPPSGRLMATSVFQRPQNRDYFLLQTRSQIARILFGNNGYYAVSATGDDFIKEALQIIHSSKYDQLIGRKPVHP
ncbi:MAG: S41 family peptidase [Chitinophagaceae bacterium]